MSDLVDRLNKQLSEMRLHALKRSSINPFGMVAEVEADQFTGFMHDVGEAADRIAELEARAGKLLTVFYSADAFLRCPAENHDELSKLIETLQESITIASEGTPKVQAQEVE